MLWFKKKIQPEKSYTEIPPDELTDVQIEICNLIEELYKTDAGNCNDESNFFYHKNLTIRILLTHEILYDVRKNVNVYLPAKLNITIWQHSSVSHSFYLTLPGSYRITRNITTMNMHRKDLINAKAKIEEKSRIDKESSAILKILEKIVKKNEH